MRVTLGVDYGDTHAASSLVQRLRFHNAAIDFTHVIADSFWTPPAGTARMPAEAMVTGTDAEELVRQEDHEAKKLLTTAREYFNAAEREHTLHLLRGNPTQVLMDHADATHADLIAVNASREGSLMAMLSGSVARGLVIGAKQSVLLARNYRCSKDDTANRPLRAVLATDHSAYMNCCVDKLLGYLPQGLSHLTVLTAFPEQSVQKLQARLPHLAVDPAEAIRHELQNRNEALAKRLRNTLSGSSTTVATQISGESVPDAIRNAMQESDADLLIIGAQGHSLLERLTIGSVSFRQAMTEPYSVLILRLTPPEIAAIRGSDYPPA